MKFSDTGCNVSSLQSNSVFLSMRDATYPKICLHEVASCDLVPNPLLQLLNSVQMENGRKTFIIRPFALDFKKKQSNLRPFSIKSELFENLTPCTKVHWPFTNCPVSWKLSIVWICRDCLFYSVWSNDQSNILTFKKKTFQGIGSGFWAFYPR